MNKNKSYENLFNNILLYVIFDLYASNMELLTNAKLYNLAMFFCAKKNYKQMKKYLIRLIFFSSNAKLQVTGLPNSYSNVFFYSFE